MEKKINCPFKIGDKVKCISTKLGFHIDIGNIYTVSKIYKDNNNDDMIKVKEIERDYDNGFYVTRFIKIPNIKIKKEEDYYKWLSDRNK